MCNIFYPSKIYRKWVYHATYEHKDENPWQTFLQELWSIRSEENGLQFQEHSLKAKIFISIQISQVCSSWSIHIQFLD